jgi:hypothetical protein
MRIALFVIKNYLACHYSLFGYRETLERMGHEVIECSFPSNQVQGWEQIAAPTIEELQKCQVILSTYHEYVQPWLEKKYTLYEWQMKVMKSVAVLARFDESMDRGDLWLPHRLPALKQWATHLSFPAAQDAEKHGGEWLPYGADTTIFHPAKRPRECGRIEAPRAASDPNPLGRQICHRIAGHVGECSNDPEAWTGKKYELAFIGTLYQKRHEYLMKLLPHIGRKTTFTSGNVIVQDLSGIAERETTERLAKNYREINIFFCLPPMSRLLVEKIFDVMACDTMVMYPRFPDDAKKNMTVFEDEKHIVYYDLGFFANNGKQVKYYLEHPETVAEIAKAGGEFVRSNYTLESMLNKMIEQATRKPNATVPEVSSAARPGAL